MFVKLLIVDDHEVVRAGLRSFLQNMDVRVVGEAESGTAALKLVQKHRPDIVVVDVRMPGDGLEYFACPRSMWACPVSAGAGAQRVCATHRNESRRQRRSVVSAETIPSRQSDGVDVRHTKNRIHVSRVPVDRTDYGQQVSG